MGNQSSKDQRLKQQHDVESLLSTWSLDDQNRLKNQYMLFSHSKEKTAKEVSGTVEVEQLSTAMTEWAPPSIQSSLASSFGYYVGQGAASISFASFLTAAQNLLRGPEQVQAAYAVYQEASRRYNCSLEQFIQWIARSGVPVWFESSGIAPPNADIWYKDEAHCQAAKRLADRLLYKAKKLKERARKREQEEMMLWLDETSTANKDERQNPLELWKIAVKQTFAVDKATFTEWIMETPDALLLLQCVAKFLFLGTTVSSDLHSLRTSGHSSPAIHAPTGESNLFDKHRFSRLLTPYDYFMLTRNLPLDALSWSSHERVRRRVSEDLAHDLIFTSRRDGMSWQVFVNRIVQQGATLLVVKAKDGSIFGGYADEPWMPVTDWYGNSSNFLFRLGTGKAYADEFLAMDAWSASQGTNDHFQYLCWGKKSLPNGLGMGGQFDYSGLWIQSDFQQGHSKAGPVCTTYQSPQLAPDENFYIDEIEVLLVRPLVRDEDSDTGPTGGGIFSRAENIEFLEMAGKKMYSKDLPEPDNKEEDANDTSDPSSK